MTSISTLLCFTIMSIIYAAYGTLVPDKPGSCPDLPPPKICKIECQNDLDCEGKQKCCRNACGKFCLTPVFKPKPGYCPKTPQLPSPCPIQCKDDSDCKGGLKCCAHGRSQSCQIPILEKPGVCPNYRLEPQCKPAPHACANDFECPDSEKCCSADCSRRCVKPRECPVLPPHTLGICVEECSTNSNCSEGQICCFNGCGHVCL